jgi:CDP-4-dehydro-6-deoxyglucose reductase
MYRVEVQIGADVRSLQTDGSQSLLESMLGSGMQVNYACRRGDCEQCVVQLKGGTVAAVTDIYPSTRGNDVFLCNAKACSDLELQVPYYPELADIKSLRTPAKIQHIERLHDKVVELTLRLPPSAKFRFLPGQFVRLSRQNVTRSYSLSAGPRPDNLLRMQIKRVSDGAMSNYLFEAAKPEDLLLLEGPQGHFFLQERLTFQRTIFVATGTGIAPIFAILASLDEQQRSRLGKIYVYWGNRLSSEEYLGDKLIELSKQIGAEYWPVRSRDPQAPGEYVQHVVARHHASFESTGVFVCGNTAMIDAMRALSNLRALNPAHFFSDPFTSS